MLKKISAGHSPVSIDTAKTHVRIDGDDEAAYLQLLLDSATFATEDRTGRLIAITTMEYRKTQWPSNILAIPVSQLREVTAITYIDPDGVEHVVDAADYQVDDMGHCFVIDFLPSFTRPALREQGMNVVVHFTAGCNGRDNPSTHFPNIEAREEMAILFLTAHWYENRESVTTLRAGAAVVPQSFEFLADQLRVYR